MTVFLVQRPGWFAPAAGGGHHAIPGPPFAECPLQSHSVTVDQELVPPFLKLLDFLPAGSLPTLSFGAFDGREGSSRLDLCHAVGGPRVSGS